MNIGSDIGLVSSGNKPSSELMLTKISDAISHIALPDYNELSP